MDHSSMENMTDGVSFYCVKGCSDPDQDPCGNGKGQTSTCSAALIDNPTEFGLFLTLKLIILIPPEFLCRRTTPLALWGAPWMYASPNALSLEPLFKGIPSASLQMKACTCRGMTLSYRLLVEDALETILWAICIWSARLMHIASTRTPRMACP